MTLKMTSALLSLALMAGPALAQDFVDAKIQELFAQGYTHFEVSRGLNGTEINAYGANNTKLEVQISNTDGTVLSQRTEVATQADFDRSIAEISQASGNVLQEQDDDLYERSGTGDRDGYDDDRGGYDDGGSDDNDHAGSDDNGGSDDHGGSDDSDHGGSDDHDDDD